MKRLIPLTNDSCAKIKACRTHRPEQSVFVPEILPKMLKLCRLGKQHSHLATCLFFLSFSFLVISPHATKKRNCSLQDPKRMFRKCSLLKYKYRGVVLPLNDTLLLFRVLYIQSTNKYFVEEKLEIALLKRR